MPPVSSEPLCPQCKSRAPIVYRGVMAYCTACGAPRIPLAAKSTNLAGKASIIGGGLTRVFGWIVLSGGVALGLALLGILQAIFPAGFAGWAVGLPIVFFSAIFGTLLLRSGRTLEGAGVAAQRETHASAIFSLAERNGNTLTAAQVAAAIGVSQPRADELLTELAKQQPDYVMLEVDDAGAVYYRVSARGLSRIQSFDQRLRVSQTEAESAEHSDEPRREAVRSRS
ncbi:MAG TPA: hypothetical protein VGH28_26580 [Polyangiaceae bacterium]|jgi:hypothetical protein